MNLKRLVSFMSSHFTLEYLKQAIILQAKIITTSKVKLNAAILTVAAAITTKSTSVVSVSIYFFN